MRIDASYTVAGTVSAHAAGGVYLDQVAGDLTLLGATSDASDVALTAEGSRRIGAEGTTSGTWILQDFGDIVLHVFTAEARKLYDLENLWADAVPVDWQAYLDGLKSA